jgi:hypothetical protein
MERDFFAAKRLSPPKRRAVGKALRDGRLEAVTR